MLGGIWITSSFKINHLLIIQNYHIDEKELTSHQPSSTCNWIAKSLRCVKLTATRIQFSSRENPDRIDWESTKNEMSERIIGAWCSIWSSSFFKSYSRLKSLVFIALGDYILWYEKYLDVLCIAPYPNFARSRIMAMEVDMDDRVCKRI